MIHFYIIVVSYNAGTGIINTLKSISRQTFTDYTVILKDGGSTDGTVEKAEGLFLSDAAFGKRCIVINESDHGIYDAMNIAIKKAEDLSDALEAKENLPETGESVPETEAAVSETRESVPETEEAVSETGESVPETEAAVSETRESVPETGESVTETDENISERAEFVYFLNCGDSFASDTVLEAVANKAQDYLSKGSRNLILYGNIRELKTNQIVNSNPVIDEFACYRNVPCHQACFYDIRLMRKEHFDTQLKVRADYEHFLRCFYIDKARTGYIPIVIADYEGGGFSETASNRQLSEQERKRIVRMYMSRWKICLYDTYRILTLAPLRTAIAENPATAGLYNRIRKALYGSRK